MGDSACRAQMPKASLCISEGLARQQATPKGTLCAGIRHEGCMRKHREGVEYSAPFRYFVYFQNEQFITQLCYKNVGFFSYYDC